MKKHFTKEKIQSELSERMLKVFESVAKEKTKYYQKNPDKIPNRENIKQIISSTGNQNAVVSAAAGVLPTPLGIAAAVPEINSIIRNQIGMVFDIGIAYGKTEFMTRELLASVFASSMGSSTIGLLSVEGRKVFVKRASLRVFQKIIAMIAGKITQKLLKSMISKMLPVVGAAAMGAWSKYSTHLIGKMAINILSKEIELEDEENDSVAEVADKSESPVDANLLMKTKIIVLSNLMKIDHEVAKEEIEFIKKVITESGLDPDTIQQLKDVILSKNLTNVDLSCFPRGHDETVGLMIDMVALAKRDGEFHASERQYIKQKGKELGFTDDEISSFMD